MWKKISILQEILSADLLRRALRSLDRTAIVMIVVGWSATVLMMGVALYTVTLAHRARQATESAQAVEPMLPVIKRAPLVRSELERFADRLRTRYHTITFNVTPDNAIDISAANSREFSDWLSALSYLDTIAPQMRWAVRDLCVGSECGGATLMRAAITAERVTFQAPTPAAEEKDEDKSDGKS